MPEEETVEGHGEARSAEGHGREGIRGIWHGKVRRRGAETPAPRSKGKGAEPPSPG